MILPKTPFSANNHFGLAFTDTSIYAMEVNDKGQVVHAAERHFQSPVISSTGTAGESISEALRQIMAEVPFSSRYAAVCLSEKFSFSRAYTLPKLAVQEISEALYWQIEKIFPFSRDEVYYDWKLIEQKEKTSTIMVTVIPKVLLDELKAALQTAGIAPISFEPSASALTRLIPEEQSDQLIVFELDSFSASASLVLNKVSVLTATSALYSNMTSEQVITLLANTIQNLRDHLKRSEKDESGLSIVITGEKANEGIAQFLEQTFAIPTSVLRVAELAASQHLAYIAASQTILPPDSEKSINLLPINLQDYYKAEMNYMLAKRAILFIFSLVLLSTLIGALGFLGTVAMKANTQRRLAEAKAAAPTVGESQYNLAIVNQKAQRVVKLFPKKMSPEQYITELFKTIPEGITFQFIRYEAAERRFEVVGIAANREALLHFRDQIAVSGFFETPTIPLPSLEDTMDADFSLEFSILETNP